MSAFNENDSVSQDSSLLAELFKGLYGCSPDSLVAVQSHASPRRRYRLQSGAKSVIGVVNTSAEENTVFTYLSQMFLALGLRVPEVFLNASATGGLLEEDLGDTTLYDLIQGPFEKRVNAAERIQYYRQASEQLALFQIRGGGIVDFTRCLDEAHSSERFYTSVFSSFYNEMLTRSEISCDLHKYENEMQKFNQLLITSPADFFLYRDFQSRNIMVTKTGLAFIDFQGGRKGPLGYDLASLLYQVSTHLSDDEKQELLLHYIKVASSETTIDVDQFNESFQYFITLRMMQVLSVYGRQGLGLGKTYFLNNIARACATLSKILAENAFSKSLPGLVEVSHKLCETYPLNPM